MEFIFADLETLSKRKEKIEKKLRSGDKNLANEFNLIENCIKTLESGDFIDMSDFSIKEDLKIIQSFQQRYLPKGVTGKLDQKTYEISHFLTS